MPAYVAYGLTIQSQFPVPELLSHSGLIGSPDISFRFGKVEVPALGEDLVDGQAIPSSEGHFVYIKNRCGRFQIVNGTEIIVDPDPDVEDRVWRLSLFGPALALLLIQRGLLVLHGGAVAFPGGTIVLLGPAGMGKSTLTAELCKMGGKLLTDDVVTVEMGQAPPMVLPGIPVLKLWPDAVDSAPEGTWTKALHPDFDKLGRRLGDQDLAAPSPLARVFFLAVGERLEREKISGSLAFRALMASQFAARYGQTFVAELDGGDLLAKVAKLLDHAPVEILRRPRDRRLLPETAALIADTVAVVRD